MDKRVWIIGGSSGIGLALVKLYLQSKAKVIVSARSATSSKELMELRLTHTDSLTLINMKRRVLCILTLCCADFSWKI